jgi:FkbM family methyltransferase
MNGFKATARGLLERLLARYGYQLRPEPELEIGFTAQYLSRLGSPRTVIDVGVGDGTWPLYEAFPDAHFVLIEPLERYRPALARIAAQYDCTLVHKAVGESPGDFEINVDTGNPQMTSFLSRMALTRTDNPIERQTVSVTRLDTVAAGLPDLAGPILLKMDTEGHELAVLRGATGLLPRVDWVIAEVSIAARFAGGYRFEELIRCMDDHGFGVFSFLSLFQAVEMRQRFADVLFERRRT